MNDLERMIAIGQWREAGERCRRQLARNPRNRELLAGCARLALMRKDWPQAESMLERLLGLEPHNMDIILALADVAECRGDWARAITRYQQGLKREPRAAIHYNLALALVHMGCREEAKQHYTATLALDPRYIPAYVNRGNLSLDAGQIEAALADFHEALRLDGRFVPAMYGLGVACSQNRDYASAASWLERALSLASNDAQAMVALAAARQSLGQLEKARAWYEKALVIAPDTPEALFNLGKIHHDAGGIRDAMHCYAEALRLSSARPHASSAKTAPIAVLAHFNLGRLLLQEGLLDPWRENFHRGTPDAGHPLCIQYGLEVALQEGRYGAADDALGQLLARLDGVDDCDQLSHLLSLAQWMDTRQEDLYRLYRRFAAVARDLVGGVELTRRNKEPAGTRMRVGFVSPDFNRHVMGFMMYEVLSRLDKEKIDLRLYALGRREDELTQGFRELSGGFVRLTGSELDMAKTIAADSIDLLVDLAGHTSGAKPLIYAYKPAPVIVTHLGYHGALGMDTVDYKITDAYADEPGNAKYLVESLLPMAGCVMPFMHHDPATVPASKARYGIPEERITLGVFVSVMKLNTRCLATWRRILEGVPAAVLAFSPSRDWMRASIERCLAQAGISLDRVVWIPMGTGSGRERYRAIDLVLDTFPYSGGDTTMAALDMGVPVVTLCGERHSERMTYSILKNLGVEGGIAYDEGDYVRIASELAKNTERRLAMAEEIRSRIKTMPLSDTRAYAKNLQEALVEAIARKICSRSPTPGT